MFVPLDRLYDFLDQYSHDDTVIYRFYPHGSKKYSNLRMLKDGCKNWHDEMMSIPMIMHDQEPLDFALYNHNHYDDILKFLQMFEPSLLKVSQVIGQIDYIIHIYQNRNLNMFKGSFLADKWLLCHSEKNSMELAKYENIDAVGVYWWSHAMIARDWYRYAQFDKKLIYDTSSFVRDFNVYNRAWSGTREYRLKFAEMIIQHDLVEHTAISIAEFDDQCHYRNHVFKNSAFMVKSDLSVLGKNKAGSNASADYCSSDYSKSSIDVILETLFDDSRIHLTEKILRPIACGKPFILVSTPGSLQYLRDYGFETFSEYIDERYDTIFDPLDRLKCIINLMKDISRLSTSKKQDLYQKLHLVADRNKKRFWSDDFAQKIIGEFITNFQHAYEICKDFRNGKNWIENRKKLAATSDKFKEFLCRDSSDKTKQDIVKLLLEIKLRKST